MTSTVSQRLASGQEVVQTIDGCALAEILRVVNAKMCEQQTQIDAMAAAGSSALEELRGLREQVVVLSEQREDLTSRVDRLRSENLSAREQADRVEMELREQNLLMHRQLDVTQAQKLKAELQLYLGKLQGRLAELNESIAGPIDGDGVMIGAFSGTFWGAVLGGPVGAAAGALTMGAGTGASFRHKKAKLMAPKIAEIEEEIRTVKLEIRRIEY